MARALRSRVLPCCLAQGPYQTGGQWPAGGQKAARYERTIARRESSPGGGSDLHRPGRMGSGRLPSSGSPAVACVDSPSRPRSLGAATDRGSCGPVVHAGGPESHRRRVCRRASPRAVSIHPWRLRASPRLGRPDRIRPVSCSTTARRRREVPILGGQIRMRRLWRSGSGKGGFCGADGARTCMSAERATPHGIVLEDPVSTVAARCGRRRCSACSRIVMPLVTQTVERSEWPG